MAKQTRKLSPINRMCTLVFPDGTTVDVQDEMRGIAEGKSLRLDGEVFIATQVTRRIERRAPALEGGNGAWVRVEVHVVPKTPDA